MKGFEPSRPGVSPKQGSPSPPRLPIPRFVGSVRRALQKAFVEEQKKRGLNQSFIARLLNVHRSVINRELKGLKDMTLGRVAELAWAMGRRPRFVLDDVVQDSSSNYQATVPPAQPLPASGVTPLSASPAHVYQMPPAAAA
jgi:hypothetical protein